MMRRAAEHVWYGESASAAAVRACLRPLSLMFGAVVRRRNASFDARSAPMPLAAISVGNLTVGGTGKTPVASWFAARLAARGAHPAIVLRGYGDDEWRVHQLLTPSVPVVMNADRLAGMREAISRGADCAVLDDAFQHRRAGRASDVVLISADRFSERVQLLPAGPYREGLSSLRRATAVIVTVKAANASQVDRVVAAVARTTPALPLAVVRLVPDRIARVSAADSGVSETSGEAWSRLRGRSLLLLSAIADATAFERQVVDGGARVVRHLRFPDHHAYSPADVAQAVAMATGTGGVLCTLKDAVKLAPLWPRAAVPLWYVSQTLVVDRGAEVLERECDRVLTARTITIPTAG